MGNMPEDTQGTLAGARTLGEALRLSLLVDCPVPELVARLKLGAPDPLHEGAETSPVELVPPVVIA